MRLFKKRKANQQNRLPRLPEDLILFEISKYLDIDDQLKFIMLNCSLRQRQRVIWKKNGTEASIYKRIDQKIEALNQVKKT